MYKNTFQNIRKLYSNLHKKFPNFEKKAITIFFEHFQAVFLDFSKGILNKYLGQIFERYFNFFGTSLQFLYKKR